MKTQVNDLRNGSKHQVLNPEVQYPRDGNVGTNKKISQQVFEQVKQQNQEELKIEVLGMNLTLKASYSTTGNFNGYVCSITPEQVLKFGMQPKKNCGGYIQFYNGADFWVQNGGKSSVHVCPSLIKIL